MSGMPIHPRTTNVHRAKMRLLDCIVEMLRDGLTIAELIQLLADEISTHAKYAIRAERSVKS